MKTNKLKGFVFLYFFAIALYSTAQINIGGKPYSWENTLTTINDIPIVNFDTPDLKKLEAEDKQDEKGGVPPRFGYLNYTNWDLKNSGNLTMLKDGSKLWQLEIYCPSALSIYHIHIDEK